MCCAQEIPRLEIPLHTLIELVPTPDGRMAEERIPFAIRRSMDIPAPAGQLAMEKQFSEMITLSVNRDGA
jgi:6-phosphofructo-2-kinase/fructose-2,6-biphosphatase